MQRHTHIALFSLLHKRWRARNTQPFAARPALAACVCALAFACLFACTFALTGCSGTSATEQEDTGGYTLPEVRTTTFNEEAAESARDCYIDTSNAALGYIMASATSSSTLKFQMLCGDAGYNYDMPNDGTAVAFPLNMGDGTYTLRVMQKIEGSNYIQLFATTTNVVLDSEFEPFLSPSIYCDFSESSACVQKARELAEGANSQAAVAEAIYNWVVENVDYDTAKAKELKNASGYIPNPDETFTTGAGICFDYASLTAAMLRSVGIPTKIVTGYVSNGSIYHAWNMVYLEGKWVNMSFTVPAKEWTRIDPAFGSAGPQIIGGKDDYVERFIY